MKTVIMLTAMFLGVAANVVFAEEDPYVPFETLKLQIKLSEDGTGIVKDVGCMNCNFSVVKITNETRAYIDGIEVNILEARKQAGKGAMVAFNPETQEVQTIRWSK